MAFLTVDAMNMRPNSERYTLESTQVVGWVGVWLIAQRRSPRGSTSPLSARIKALT